MPVEMNIKPDTNRNLRPIGSFGPDFRFGSGSLGALIVFVVFNVFWDIPFLQSIAKVNNLARIPLLTRIFQIYIVIFLLNMGDINAQKKIGSTSYTLIFRDKSQIIDTFRRDYSDPKSIDDFLKTALKEKVNNGYPFTEIHFDTIYYSKMAEIYATLKPGPFVFNGEIINHGDTSINLITISKFLRTKKNFAFSDSKQKKIPILLNQIPFIESIESPRQEFFGNQSIVHLNLIKRKTNYFNGILGLLPQGENKGGTIVTGNIDGSLNNLFGRGLQFYIKWNRFAPESQKADIKLIGPNLTFSGLGFETNFELFKQDSTINKQNFDFKISSSPGGIWKFLLGISSGKSFGPGSLENNQKVKINTNSFSLSIVKNSFQPPGIQLKKNFFRLSLAPTLKKIDKPETVESMPQLNWDILLKYPFSLKSKRFNIQLSSQFSGLISKEITLQDQLRTGGIYSVRGFNENQFFGSQFFTTTIQPQYLVDKNLLIGLFSDFIVVNEKLNQFFLKNSLFGVGLGISTELDLGANSIQLSIANGIISGNPIDLQTTKIHFGYIARF
jgi:hypothetical protein